MGAELPWLDRIQRAKASVRLPVVLTLRVVGALREHVLNRGGRGEVSPLDD